MTKRAGLSPSQLGALTRGGLVKVDDGSRRPVELFCATESQEVWTRIATDDDGNELDVLAFPPDVFTEVLEVLDVDDPEDQDQLRVGGMVWLRRSE